MKVRALRLRLRRCYASRKLATPHAARSVNPVVLARRPLIQQLLDRFQHLQPHRPALRVALIELLVSPHRGVDGRLVAVLLESRPAARWTLTLEKVSQVVGNILLILVLRSAYG